MVFALLVGSTAYGNYTPQLLSFFAIADFISFSMFKERDSSGNNSAAFDCCFHPEAIAFCQGEKGHSKPFRDLLIRTAMEGVEESYRRQRQTVALETEYHVLKGVAYKSGTPPTMLIDTQSKQRVWSPESVVANAPSVEDIKQNFPMKKTSEVQAASPAPAPVVPVPPVSSTSTIKYGQAARAKEPGVKKGFLEPKTTTVASQYPVQPVAVVSPSSSSSSSHTQQPSSPSGGKKVTARSSAAIVSGGVRYTVSERGVMSLGYSFPLHRLYTLHTLC